jgi:hypothetical protein
MVIYCQIPERGGHTQFQDAGVHVRPTERAAIFFSYIDPETNLTDKGFTRHSGCPVFEGGASLWLWGTVALRFSPSSHTSPLLLDPIFFKHLLAL